MSDVTIGGMGGAGTNSALQEWYNSNDDIDIGGNLDYQTAKLIFTQHPLGMKIAGSPVKLAMSQKREISIPNSPESMVKEEFEREWNALHIDDTIEQITIISRAYGVAAVVIGASDYPMEEPLSSELIANKQIYFNVLDPLNTAGSLTLNQDPNAPDFQKCTTISAAGKPYHFSRSCILQNESPIYLSYTSSTFGYNGRSAYQRIIYSLKSYLTAQIASDELLRKVSVIVASRKGPGSFTDKISGKVASVLRNWIKSATNGNVISIDTDDKIETLDLTNADKVLETTRKMVLQDISLGSGMPVALIDEGYAGVLANGTEDFKATMQYIDGIRKSMQPLYVFFDAIVQQRAWSQEFYARLQAQFPEYKDKSYQQAFYDFKNSFEATWPSLLVEPDSEKSKGEKVKLEAIISLMEKLGPSLDPDNSAALIEWVSDNINSYKTLFSDPLEINPDTLVAFLAEKNERENVQAQPDMGGLQ